MLCEIFLNYVDLCHHICNFNRTISEAWRNIIIISVFKVFFWYFFLLANMPILFRMVHCIMKLLFLLLTVFEIPYSVYERRLPATHDCLALLPGIYAIQYMLRLVIRQVSIAVIPSPLPVCHIRVMVGNIEILYFVYLFILSIELEWTLLLQNNHK